MRAYIVMVVACLVAACSQAPSLAPDHRIASDRAGPETGLPGPEYVRQRVRYATPHLPGTVVVDTHAKFLYLVLADGDVLRYGIGVGRDGFAWSGTATVARKARWPRWTPPADMIRRQPELTKYRAGMAPGIDNPLGARALYLFQNGVDTLYRIHGTNEAWSIGRDVSSGCIRLLNEDVVDLFGRVPIGSRVVVLDHRADADRLAGGTTP